MPNPPFGAMTGASPDCGVTPFVAGAKPVSKMHIAHNPRVALSFIVALVILAECCTGAVLVKGLLKKVNGCSSR